MKFSFREALPGDDREIRALLARNPMPGSVTVSFERDPDYFLGEHVMGDPCVTIVAVDEGNGPDRGCIAGIVSIAISRRYLGGEVVPVGYIGQLRIDSAYRGYMIPLRAANFIRGYMSEYRPGLWFTVFADENPEAVSIFTEVPRPSFPSMRFITGIRTLGLQTRRQRGARIRAHIGFSILRGSEIEGSRLYRFLETNGPTRDFFPADPGRELLGDRRTPGFDIDRVFVAVDGEGEILGLCHVWDQSSFKQSVVHGYRGVLRRLRPVINFAGPLLGIRRLPDPGRTIDAAYLHLSLVERDDPRVFRSLLEHSLGEAWLMEKDYLFAGFCTDDPLLRVARRFRHINYSSSMYAFGFSNDAKTRCAAGRPRYVEISRL